MSAKIAILKNVMLHSASPKAPNATRKLTKKRVALGVLALLIVVLLAARLYLNVWAKDYVNQALDNIDGYQGSIADIDIDLYRGAYRIYKLQLNKKTGHIPTPFIDIASVDLSIQWSALFRGRIVSNADLNEPVINFAINKEGTTAQTGVGVDWTKPIKDLMPIDINLVTFTKGKLSYQDFSTTPNVNIYINNMTGEVRNLRNVVDENKALPSTLVVRGNSIGNGRLDLRGKLNILKPIPDMNLDLKLEKVHLPALSNYSEAYAAVDIEQGTLNIYSEMSIKDGIVNGYLKPIATNVAMINLAEKDNPFEAVWEVLVGAIVEIFTNQKRDQFATKIPLEGDLNNVETDTPAAIAGIISNAFFDAVKKGFE